jgi:hypothetical protein
VHENGPAQRSQGGFANKHGSGEFLIETPILRVRLAEPYPADRNWNFTLRTSGSPIAERRVRAGSVDSYKSATSTSLE